MLDPEFKQWGTQCVTDARAMIQKITSKLEEIDSSDMQQEKALYDSAITTLKFRLECLKRACSFDGDWKIDVSKAPEQQRAFNAWLESSAFTGSRPCADEPFKEFADGSFKCLTSVVAGLDTYTIASDEDIKNETNN